MIYRALSVIIFAGFASAQLASTATPTTKQAETPEHTYARMQYDLAQHELDESKKDYAERLMQDGACKSYDALIGHPVTIESIDERMVGCNYETRKSRYVMEKVGEALTQLKAQLDHVDDCLKVYLSTIDKKLSDQTQREVEGIKACQSERLYPPPRAK